MVSSGPAGIHETHSLGYLPRLCVSQGAGGDEGASLGAWG